MDAPAFPEIRRLVTAAMVRRYGEVNGDRNLIHYDEAAARAAGFPRPVVHGALTAAVLSEACREHFGAAWLEGGELAVRFVKPLLVEETVSTHGRLIAEEPAPGGRYQTWAVWCQNGAGDQVLVGEARGVVAA